MATDNNCNIICLVNGTPKNIPPKERKRSDHCSAVIYYENANLETFKHRQVPTKHLCKVKPKEGEPLGYVTWEDQIWVATFESLPELRFNIAISPKDKDDLISGVAYAKADPTKSIPKAFHIYPGKQYMYRDGRKEWLYLDYDDDFFYTCVYYGTEDDRQIEVLKNGPEKIPDEIPWKSSAGLEAEIARLEKEAARLETEATRLGNENRELVGKATESKNENEKLRKEKNKLGAVVKALGDAIEDLKNDGKSETSGAGKDGTSNTGGENKPPTE